MMEQMSILFDCVRRAGPTQAQLLAEILPRVLISSVNFGQDTIQLSIEMKDPLPSLNNTGAH